MADSQPFGVANVVTWVARVASIVAAATLAAFLAGSFGQGERIPNLVEAIGFAFFPVGILAGMAIGWRYPLAGGFVTICSLGGFYTWHLIVAQKWPGGIYFLLFAVPGILFFVAGAMRRYRDVAR